MAKRPKNASFDEMERLWLRRRPRSARAGEIRRAGPRDAALQPIEDQPAPAPKQGRRDNDGEDSHGDESEIAIVVEQKPHGHRRHAHGRKRDQQDDFGLDKIRTGQIVGSASSAGNAIPIIMNSARRPRPNNHRSRARRSFKRPGEQAVENLHGSKPSASAKMPRAPSGPPG